MVDENERDTTVSRKGLDRIVHRGRLDWSEGESVANRGRPIRSERVQTSRRQSATRGATMHDDDDHNKPASEAKPIRGAIG